MVTRAPTVGDVAVYEISSRWSGPPPTWAAPTGGGRVTAKEKKRVRQLELRNTAGLDILQDLEFPTVCTQVMESPDGRHVVAAGTYAPQVRVFDVEQLSMKFQRNLDCEIVKMAFLQEDWKKLAFICADRTLEIHGQMGVYYKTRVPKFGRDIGCLTSTSDLYVCGVGPEVYRLNLEEGRFIAPLITTSGANGGNNCMTINPVNHLLGFGGDTGIVEVWDPRHVADGKAAGSLDVAAALSQHISWPAVPEITAMSFDAKDGLTLGVGTSTGHTMLFDLRSPKAPFAKDQGYGLPINTVDLHASGRVISSDSKNIKIWSRQDGASQVTVEPKSKINSLCAIRNTGVVFAACETPKVQSYYIPSLGLAPKWCSFLESLTEELEEGAARGHDQNNLVYENYKFVTRDELESLELGHLLGTNLLRAYMHGFFIDLRLYRKARDAAEPLAYENYRKEKIQAKIDEERESRIAKVQKKSAKPKINAKAAAISRTGLVEDDRFKAMFEDKHYAIDEEAERYRLLNPTPGSKKQRLVRDDDSDDDRLGYSASTRPEVHEDNSSDDDSSSDDETPSVPERRSSRGKRPHAPPQSQGGLRKTTPAMSKKKDVKRSSVRAHTAPSMSQLLQQNKTRRKKD